MLSDDVKGAVGTTVSKTGAVLGGGIRGGLLGAALTFVGGALFLAAESAIGAAGAGAGFLAASGAALTGVVTGAAFMATAGLPVIIAGAAIGALALGLGAILPGVSNLFKGGKKAAASRDSEPERCADQQVAVQQQPSCPAPKRVIVCDNPHFVEGRGTAAMEKGDSAQSAAICR